MRVKQNGLRVSILTKMKSLHSLWTEKTKAKNQYHMKDDYGFWFFDSKKNHLSIFLI